MGSSAAVSLRPATGVCGCRDWPGLSDSVARGENPKCMLGTWGEAMGGRVGVAGRRGWG